MSFYFAFLLHRLCGGKAYDEESCILASPMDLSYVQVEWLGPVWHDVRCRLEKPNFQGKNSPHEIVKFSKTFFFVTDYRFFGWLRSEGVLVQGHRFNTQRAIILVAISFGKPEVGRTAFYPTRLRTAVEVQKPGRCVAWERDKDGISLEVPNQFCDPFEKPNSEESCRLFCTNDCVVSEWTSWTECKVSLRSICFCIR